MDSSLVQEYLTAKLVELEAAIDDLEAQPETDESADVRKKLAAQQANLVAALALHADDPP